MAYQQSISDCIALFISRTGKTKEELASMLGFNRNTLANKCSGTTDWTMSEVVSLSEITGDSIEKLLGLQSA